MYNVYVTKVKNVRPAENCDNLNLCEVFDNTTIVNKSVNEDTLYLYFPVDGQISKEYGEQNNLFRKRDTDGRNIGGFIDEEKRNIRAIRLRGNRSDGLVMPLSSLSYLGNVDKLKQGDTVEIFNGHLVAEKYIPKVNPPKTTARNAKKNTEKHNYSAFKEHVDTAQLVYNLNQFKAGDLVEVSIKMHGTSGRTGYLPVNKTKLNPFEKLAKKFGYEKDNYEYVSGSRRVVLKSFANNGWYEDNSFRKIVHDMFVGKLHKGETVFYEIVGFTPNGTPIMPTAQNKEVGKDFVKLYGKETVFSYGCNPDDPQPFDVYVYRINMTGKDGYVTEYSPEHIRVRCEQIGVKAVPSCGYYIPPFENSLMEFVEEMASGADPIGKTHIREGVVVRHMGKTNFAVYKYKNFDFKVLAGIATNNLSEMEATGAEADLLAEM